MEERFSFANELDALDAVCRCRARALKNQHRFER